MQTVVIHLEDIPNMTEKSLARAVEQLIRQQIAPVRDVIVLPGDIPAGECPAEPLDASDDRFRFGQRLGQPPATWPPGMKFDLPLPTVRYGLAESDCQPGGVEEFYQSQPWQTVINLHLAPGMEADVASTGNASSITVRSR